MLYPESDYNRMKWHLHKLPEKTDILKEFKDLKDIYQDALAFGIENNCTEYLTPSQLMKFIVYSYHYHSPFQKVSEPSEKKKKVLREIGIDLVKQEKDPQAKEFFVNLLLSQNDFVSYLSLHFLRFENNRLWVQACTLNELIATTTLLLRSSDSKGQNAAQFAKVQAEAYDKAKSYHKDYDRVCKELMADDLALQDYLDSHILREKRKAIITPERFVKAVEETDNNPFQL